MKIVLATHNQGKIREFRKAFAEIGWEALPIAEVADVAEPEETGTSFKENALLKAHYYAKAVKLPVLSDDSGIIADALGDRPGIYSARYAGPAKDSVENMKKVLREMEGISDRKACFRTVIALIQGKEEHLFEGRVDGKILTAQQGEAGFGYDPIFQPEGFDLSFAEMPMDEKNKISHRGRALRSLLAKLKDSALSR